MTIHSQYQVRISRANRMTWVDPRVGRTDAITMINDGVTNLSGKSLNKVIHCSIKLLAK